MSSVINDARMLVRTYPGVGKTQLRGKTRLNKAKLGKVLSKKLVQVLLLHCKIHKQKVSGKNSTILNRLKLGKGGWDV